MDHSVLMKSNPQPIHSQICQHYGIPIISVMDMLYPISVLDEWNAEKEFFFKFYLLGFILLLFAK